MRAQQETASGLGVKDRFKVAKGENVRWEATRRDRGEDGEEGGEGGSSAAASRVGGRTLPPGPPSRNLGPPPSRGAALAGGAPPPINAASKPPLPSRGSTGAAPPPSLPPRMGNDNGISNPPPPYVGAKPGLPARSGAAPAAASYVQFSTMDQTEKQAFFTLLDQYFASRGGNVTPAAY